MLFDWVRSGRTGKYLALGQEVWTSLRSVRTLWPRAKYFPVRPSHSVDKYIICMTDFTANMLQVIYFVITCEEKFSKVRLEIFKCTWIKRLLETNLASRVKPSCVKGDVTGDDVVMTTLGSLSKPRRRQEQELNQTRGLMSKTIAVHVHYKSLFISLPPSAKHKVKWPSSASSTGSGRRQLIVSISI